MTASTVDRALLDASPYAGYSYAYPHKTAYRPLDPPVALADAWADEPRDALFLYVHVPFCEMRCGFCNLFTQALPEASLVTRYLAAFRRQAAVVRDRIGDARWARLAVGGGTPTFLDAEDLASVFDVARDVMGVELGRIPTSIEVSPATIDSEKLHLLAERGVTRASVGVQSFVEAEAKAAGRPQTIAAVDRALGLLRDARFPTLNVDLIYGIDGQTTETLTHSLRRALDYRPEEIYLYPLYVRPLTGLGKRANGARADAPQARHDDALGTRRDDALGTRRNDAPRTRRDDAIGTRRDDARLALYRAARDLLRAAGYAQHSMRMFRLASAPAEGGPVYCCQNDGMVGLGCGARSYTRALHYSDEYAVERTGVRELVAGYVARDDREFGRASYGFRLDAGEQRRRFVIQSLLSADGLDFDRYEERFGTSALDDLPSLAGLEPPGLALLEGRTLRLTDAGVERSDAIGPWLYSPDVNRLTLEYEAR